jgi:RHS repeat-associated protein
VVYVQHPALGTFAIEIDGQVVRTVSSTTKQSAFGTRTQIRGLTAGEHTLRITAVSGTIAIDAFGVEAAVESQRANPTAQPSSGVSLGKWNPDVPTDGGDQPMRLQSSTEPEERKAHRSITYDYDALRRLKAATIAVRNAGDQTLETQQHSYDYDLRGNRTRAQLTINGIPDYTDVYGYNAANQITTRSLTKGSADPIVVSYQYDFAGNLKNDGTYNYNYDRANRPIELVPVQGNTSFANRYNGLGLRTQQQLLIVGAPTITTDYLLDMASPLPSVLRETTAGATTHYLLGLDKPIASRRGSNWAIFGYDGLGSVRQVTRHEVDRPLNLCELLQGQCIGGVIDYDPYGVVTRREGSMVDTLSLGYTGEMTDANGLVYLRSRYMNPATGTFLTRDPVEGTLDKINSRNGYGYVEGNPVNFTDPSGQCIGPLVIGCGALLLAGAKIFAAGAAVSGAFSIGMQLAFSRRIDLGQTVGDAFEGGVMSLIMGPVGGAIKGLGFRGVKAALVGFGADVAIGTAWDMSVHRRTPTDALVGNLIGGAVGGYIGYRLDLNPRRAALEGEFCSFSADTNVATEDGDRPISQIKIGDKVRAYHEATGKTESETVTAVMVHTDPVIVHLTLDGERIETTPEHPFYTIEGKWVAAGTLKVGDRIRKADGTYGMVDAGNFVERDQQMYNLTVDEAHTFFVGDGQWLVHNECDFSQLRERVRQLRDAGFNRSQRRSYIVDPTQYRRKVLPLRDDFGWERGQLLDEEYEFLRAKAQQWNKQIVMSGSFSETDLGLIRRYDPESQKYLPAFRRSTPKSGLVDIGAGDVDFWEGSFLSPYQLRVIRNYFKQIDPRFVTKDPTGLKGYKLRYYPTLDAFNEMAGAIVFNPGGTTQRIAGPWQRRDWP